METLETRWQWTLVALGVIFYLFLFPHGIHGDGSTRYTSLMGLVTDGQIRPMVYSYVGPLISLPLHYLGLLVKTPNWWMTRFNTFVFLGAAFYLWSFFTREWSRAQGRLFLLLLLCATMFPKHVTDYYSEVFSACLAAIAITLFLRDRFLPGSALLCLSAWNTPGTLVAAAAACGYFFLRERRFRYAILPFPLAGGIFLENFLKYGEFFPKAYLEVVGPTNFLPYSHGPGFSYPLFFGLISVLLSAGKGLIFFSPGLLAVFCAGIFRDSAAGRFLAAGGLYILGLLLVFSRWWAWTGDWFWGPRFYLFTSIWAVVAFVSIWPTITASYRRHTYWVFAVLLSLWVGCIGVTYGQDFLKECDRTDGIDIMFMCHYVPEFSALWRVFIVWPTPQGRKIAYLVFFFLVAATVLWDPAKAWLRATWRWARDYALDLLRDKNWKV